MTFASEDHAKLRRVGVTRRQDLPAAGVELVGDGAVSGERDLVGGSGHRPELEDCDVDLSRDLHGAVHAVNLRRLRVRVRAWG